MSAPIAKILHVDMDAFYAAIEQRDHPEWRGRPVVVGSAPDARGVVATCSYEARRYGIHSAMPSRTAGRLCPQAIFVAPRMAHYAEVSARLMAVFEEFTPLVEALSLDEAFLDTGGALHLWGDAVTLARALKTRVRERLDLTASVGVATNKFLAKIASDLDKPDGLTVVPTDADAITVFLAPLPVTKLWGVGKVTGARLMEAGVHTIGDVQRLPAAALCRLLGEASGRDLRALAFGLDDRPVVTHREEKSLSNEHTFPVDEADPGRVRQRLIELTEEVGRRLRAAGRRAGTGQIKVRFGDFRTLTRQASLAPATDTDRELIACALKLYDRERIREPVRLVGFGVSRLGVDAAAEPPQLELFQGTGRPARDVRSRSLDDAVDALRRAFGDQALRRGAYGRGGGRDGEREGKGR
jgi:nucleotidyltransferase/DNA polymerase involved in DNA repair